MLKSSEISFQSELKRKGIHLLSLLIPIVYYNTDILLILKLLFPLTFLFVLFDWLSKKKSIVRQYIIKLFGSMLRQHEVYDKFALNGASWVMISACITILVFPKMIAITALSVLVTSDTSAALIGRRFGRNPYCGKTLEGTIAFIVFGWLTIITVGIIANMNINFFICGAVAVLFGCFSELFSSRFYVDDNLSIPLAFSISMVIGNSLLPFLA
jgi:dolichol kinase